MLKILSKLFKKDESIRTGDLVICIDDKPVGDGFPPKLEYGKVYRVRNLTSCQKCKTVVIDVGIKPNHPIFSNCKCGKWTFPGKDVHWAGVWRFRKLTKDEQKEYVELENKKAQKKFESLLHSDSENQTL